MCIWPFFFSLCFFDVVHGVPTSEWLKTEMGCNGDDNECTEDEFRLLYGLSTHQTGVIVDNSVPVAKYAGLIEASKGPLKYAAFFNLNGVELFLLYSSDELYERHFIFLGKNLPTCPPWNDKNPPPQENQLVVCTLTKPLRLNHENLGHPMDCNACQEYQIFAKDKKIDLSTARKTNLGTVSRVLNIPRTLEDSVGFGRTIVKDGEFIPLGEAVGIYMNVIFFSDGAPTLVRDVEKGALERLNSILTAFLDWDGLFLQMYSQDPPDAYVDALAKFDKRHNFDYTLNFQRESKRVKDAGRLEAFSQTRWKMKVAVGAFVPYFNDLDKSNPLPMWVYYTVGVVTIIAIGMFAMLSDYFRFGRCGLCL